MANPNETIKYCMLRYPTLYKNPIDVLVSAFLAISTMQWNKGEVDHTEWEKDYKGTMCYDSQYKHNISDSNASNSLYVGYALNEEVELARLKFVDSNIERIVAAPHVNTYFGIEPDGAHIVRDIGYAWVNDDDTMRLPNNLTKEWAIELCEFIQYALVRLNYAYHIGTGKTEEEWTKHWPDDAKHARKVLMTTQEKFYKKAYGKTKKEADDFTHKLMTEILGELKDE
jgi:hypothetical protein